MSAGLAPSGSAAGTAAGGILVSPVLYIALSGEVCCLQRSGTDGE